MKKRYFIIGLGLIVAGLIGATTVRLLYTGSSQGSGMMGMMRGKGMVGDRGMMGAMMGDMEEISKKTEFSSNGERIFYTGTTSRGEGIRNSHGMQGVGCAMCHGVDAKGRKMMMMDVPSLRWEILTDPEGHVHTNGRKHPPFTEPSFKACVLAGVDSGGNSLSTMMPKWEMSNEDLDNLIGYLKTR